jgi:hypothetical protein
MHKTSEIAVIHWPTFFRGVERWTVEKQLLGPVALLLKFSNLFYRRSPLFVELFRRRVVESLSVGVHSMTPVVQAKRGYTPLSYDELYRMHRLMDEYILCDAVYKVMNETIRNTLGDDSVTKLFLRDARIASLRKGQLVTEYSSECSSESLFGISLRLFDKLKGAGRRMNTPKKWELDVFGPGPLNPMLAEIVMAWHLDLVKEGACVLDDSVIAIDFHRYGTYRRMRGSEVLNYRRGNTVPSSVEAFSRKIVADYVKNYSSLIPSGGVAQYRSVIEEMWGNSALEHTVLFSIKSLQELLTRLKGRAKFIISTEGESGAVMAVPRKLVSSPLVRVFTLPPLPETGMCSAGEVWGVRHRNKWYWASPDDPPWEDVLGVSPADIIEIQEKGVLPRKIKLETRGKLTYVKSIGRVFYSVQYICDSNIVSIPSWFLRDTAGILGVLRRWESKRLSLLKNAGAEFTSLSRHRTYADAIAERKKVLIEGGRVKDMWWTEEDDAIIELYRPGMPYEDQVKLSQICLGRSKNSIESRASVLRRRLIAWGTTDVDALPHKKNYQVVSREVTRVREITKKKLKSKLKAKEGKRSKLDSNSKEE